jgi:hypothetical protein
MLRGSRVLAIAGAAAVTAGLMLGTAAAGPTATPRAGATYKGEVTTHTGSEQEIVVFDVSKSGKVVKHMRVADWPLNMCGQGGPLPRQSSEPARITKAGRFTAHVLYHGGGTVIAKAKVTGEFLRHGNEKGTIIGNLVGEPQCEGTYSYTTHAK